MMAATALTHRRGFLGGLARAAVAAPILAHTAAATAADEVEETELEEAQRHVGHLIAKDRSPEIRSGVQLMGPGCSAGCGTCFRSCAVNRIKLDWWRNELSSLVGKE